MGNREDLIYTQEFAHGKLHIELEAADTLGVLLKRVRVELNSPPPDVKTALRKQSAAIVERLSYVDDLKLIEVDGIANAVQIRSQRPTGEGFTEVILRRGNSILLERRGAALHISRKNFDRLLSDLSNV